MFLHIVRAASGDDAIIHGERLHGRLAVRLAPSEGVDQGIAQYANGRHGDVEVQILQQKGRQLREGSSSEGRAGTPGGIVGRLALPPCSPIVAFPSLFLPFAAGWRIRGFRRSEGGQEAACSLAASLDRGDFLTRLKELVPIYGLNVRGGDGEEFEVGNGQNPANSPNHISLV